MPFPWAAVIGALGSAGGAAASRSNFNSTRRGQAKQFQVMMNESVQRRVGDAKRAGIHPLAALGMSPSAGPTLTGAGAGAEGDAIARGGESLANAIGGKRLQDAQLEQVNSSKELNEAQAAYYRSLAARASPNSPGTDGSQLDNGVRTYPYPEAEMPIYVRPEVPTRDSTGYQTGRRPAMELQRLPDGRHLKQFTGQMDEVNQVYAIQQLAKYALTDGMKSVDKWVQNNVLKHLEPRGAARRRAQILQAVKKQVEKIRKEGNRTGRSRMWR